MSASKLLITGLEATGKTTVTSQLEKALVVSIDGKAYPFSVPHYRPGEYAGLDLFKAELITPIRRGICNMQAYGYANNKLVVEAELMAQIARKKDTE